MRIFLHDEFDPETSAMLQALYSRSSDSVENHVAKVRERGSGRFMESYYVGYGHASIGDCGTTTLYFEGISILAAKAIQDTSLFSGQETSTRYIDFGHQPLVDPVGSEQSTAYLRSWIDWYEAVMPSVREALRARFPLEPGAVERTWSKAIDARAFDIMRGFLPAAVTTQTSWTTSLRHAHEHVLRLEHHPLEEVREIGRRTRALLRERYPSSFSHVAAATDDGYLQALVGMDAYLDPDSIADTSETFRYRSSIDNDELERSAGILLAQRPKRAPVPQSLAELGYYRCEFLLDFGSFRDLQRHRNGICRMPLLTDKFGFNSWYLEQLPSDQQAAARAFIAEQRSKYHELCMVNKLAPAAAQYYLPIGMNVFCRLTYDLPQMVYVAELRSGQTVHPTLRSVAQDMALVLRGEHPGMVIYADLSPSEFCVRRGEQDIVEIPLTPAA